MLLIFCIMSLESFGESSGAADSYQIQCARPSKVGDRFHVDALTEESQSETVNGKKVPVNASTCSLTLSAAAEVMELAADSTCRKVRYTIDRANEVDDGKTTEVLVKGSVVIATIGPDGAEYAIDGAAAKRKAASFLAELSLGIDTGVRDNEAFGSREPRSIGDSWPANGEGAGKLINLKPPPGAISGDVRLAEAVKNGGSAAIKLTSELHVAHVALESTPGMTEKSGSIVIRFSGIYPVDATKRALRRSLSYESEFVREFSMNGASGEAINRSYLLREVRFRDE